MTRLLSSLRVRLTLLVLAALVPALVLFLFSASEQRRLVADHAQHDALHLARIVLDQEKRLFEDAQALLESVSRVPSVREARTASADCARLLQDFLRQYPSYLNIGVIDSSGAVMCSALPFDESVDLSDRSYFRRALATRGFSVGNYQVGRITGRPSVNFGMPLFGDDGDVRAVVFAAMDLTWLNRLPHDAGLPDGVTATVVDSDGRVLAHSRDPDKWVGRTLPNPAVARAIAGRDEGVITVTGPDGIERLHAFTRLNHGRSGAVFLCIDIPTDIAFAHANELARRNMISLIAVTLLVLVAAWFGGHAFITRRVERLVRAATRLGQGDLRARARDEMEYGRDEIGQLARVFDQMAESISQREDELSCSHDKLATACDATIEGWARALERRDSETQGHTRRVAETTIKLARQMNYPEGDIVHIHRGALLHDIGKMGIPDSILLKQGPLNDEEWDVMRRHPTYAYEWLSHIELLRPALEIPYCHHERWDGSGYPRGLVGKEIPLAARLFAVVDVWDALTSDRPYRDAWSEERTLEYLQENAGILFDPAVVHEFITMVGGQQPDAEILYQSRHRDTVVEYGDETEETPVLPHVDRPV